MLSHAMFAKDSKTKNDFTKKGIKRLKRIKDIIIKLKDCQKSARIKKMVKNARFS